MTMMRPCASTRPGFPQREQTRIAGVILSAAIEPRGSSSKRSSRQECPRREGGQWSWGTAVLQSTTEPPPRRRVGGL